VIAGAYLREEGLMKLLIGFLVVIWLACGLLGAWRLGDMRFKTISRGPIALVKAFNDAPVSYPGPN
jgi:hypothetical protein